MNIVTRLIAQTDVNLVQFAMEISVLKSLLFLFEHVSCLHNEFSDVMLHVHHALSLFFFSLW